MYTKRYVLWLVGLSVALAGLSVSAATMERPEIEPFNDSYLCEPGAVRGGVDDPCEFIESLEVTCDVERSKLSAIVSSDLPPCTPLRLVADEAFYRDTIVRGNGQAWATWRYPMPGWHEVCISECDICAAAMCGCATDADCDDEEFCNGQETCDIETAECLEGEYPCAEGETCNEEDDICEPACTGFTWEKLATPLAVGAPMHALHGGRLYAFGGMVTVGPGYYDNTYSDAIRSYDLAAGQWNLMNATLPYAGNVPAQAVVVDDTLYISPYIGPTQNNGWGTHNSIIKYDFLADAAWEDAAYPGYSIIWHCGLSRADDGTVYSFGGWKGSAVSKIFRYDDPPGILTLLPAMLPSGHQGPRAICRDGDGNTILFGDYPDWASLMVFDPATESIVYSEQIIPDELAWAHIAWRDQNNRVFLADGYVNDIGNQVVYEFDSITKTFTPADFSLPTPDTGAYLGSHAYDAQSGKIYISEYLLTGSTYETWLWIGTPCEG